MNDVNLVRIMARGVYDLQKLRMQMGLRLCANFRAKLKPQGHSNPSSVSEPALDSNPRDVSGPQTASNPQLRSEPRPDRSPEKRSAPLVASNPLSASAPGQRSNPDIHSEPIAASNPRDGSAPENNSTPHNRSEPAKNSSPLKKSAPRKSGDPQARSEPELGSNPDVGSEPESGSNPLSVSEDPTDDNDEADEILKRLRESYRRLTDGIARNRTLPTEKGFKGDELIGSHAELVLVHQYIAIEREEEKQFRMMVPQLEKVPIYSTYLHNVVGVGPAMASVLIGWLDPHKARHVSSFWRYAGLDVGSDGRGRSRRSEHLVEREYVDRNGELKRKLSVTYEPFVKSKLMGVLAGSFIRTGSPWREVYDSYKHRLETDPSRAKVPLVEYKRRNKQGEDVTQLWPPGRINDAAKRYMVKMFLAELWVKWRTLEGLPVTEPYTVTKQGRRPHAA